MSAQRWIVSQIGAREHYAVPRALENRNRLDQLYTDAWCRYGHSVLRRMPDPLRSYANRYHPEIPSAKVKSFDGWALYNRIRWRLSSSKDHDEQYYEHHRRIGASFAEQVRISLTQENLDTSKAVFLGYNTGCLETLDFLSDSGCFTIVDQIDPGQIHKEIVQKEAERWPSWSTQIPVFYEPYEKRLRTEWKLASVVVVNSEWSKQALIKQGVASSKIEVVPLAYEPSFSPTDVSNRKEEAPLRVLWLGSVRLAKGIPYLIQAARALEEAPVRFEIVGPIHISEKAVASAPSNVTFVGRVSRDETESWYREADVFVLPTLSDGFAITQLEAMAHGLPVIATPNCGRVVTDGEDGYVVPPRDVGALVRSLTRFVQFPDRVLEMGRKAHEKAQTYTLDRVADRLIEIVSRDG